MLPSVSVLSRMVGLLMAVEQQQQQQQQQQASCFCLASKQAKRPKTTTKKMCDNTIWGACNVAFSLCSVLCVSVHTNHSFSRSFSLFSPFPSPTNYKSNQTMAPKRGEAVVHSVLSGDTVVLRGRAANGPPPTFTLSLAQLECPRLAKRPNASNPNGTKDEVCAVACVALCCQNASLGPGCERGGGGEGGVKNTLH